MPWRRKWQPTPVFLPGKSHGWSSLAGYIQFTRSQRVGHKWTTSLLLFTEYKKAFDLMQSDSWVCIFDICQPRKEILYLGSKEHANTSVYLELRLYSHPSWVSEKAMAPHSSTLAWKIPWMEEPGWLLSMGSQKVGHDWATLLHLRDDRVWETEMLTNSECDMITKGCTFQLVSKLGENSLG